MKTMKNYIWMAAATMMAATLGACSNDDLTAIETPIQKGKVVTLTATLSPKDGDGTTRALSDPGDGTLTSAWAVNEEIWVQYDDEGHTSPTAKARVTSVNGSGEATITVDLVDPVSGQIDFNYPYDAVVLNKEIYYDQLGTLADVSANYDMCSGSGTLTVVGSEATLPTGVAMTRDVFIWKFTFTDGGSDITNKITSLSIDDGGGCPYTISPSGQSTIYVAMYGGMGEKTYTITAATNSGIYTKAKSDISLVNGKLYTTNALALDAKEEVNLATKTEDYTANNGDILTGTLPAAYKLIIPMDAVVMLKNATIAYGGYDATAVECQGNATIVLADGTTNAISVPGAQDGGPGDSGSPYPGIRVGGSGTRLTFKGNTGTLEVIGGYIAAGIGSLNVGGANGMGESYSSWDGQCGVIQIDGGVISAYSGNKTSLGDGGETGIGNVCGGSADLCEGIIINGGTITAKGGTAGIGCSGGATCNFITINGGTVNATGGNGAGIGSAPSANVLKITINGGNITTYGGGGGASPGIGAGTYGNCGPITITGGTINSYGGVSSAGIGSGQNGHCGNIAISGGTIKAVGDEPGIGSGAGGSCGNITITGGVITAVSSEGWNDSYIAAHNGTGPGIGAGMASTCGAISISGGTIVANGGSACAGIGSAGGGTSSYTSLTISTGITSVTATRGLYGTANEPIGHADGDTTSPNPVFTGVTKQGTSTDDMWIYE